MFGTHMMRLATVFSALAVCPPKLTNQVKSVQKEINADFTIAVLPILVVGTAVAVFKAMPHIENCLQQIKQIALTPKLKSGIERVEQPLSHVVDQKKRVQFVLPVDHVDKETRQTGVRKKKRYDIKMLRGMLPSR